MFTSARVVSSSSLGPGAVLAVGVFSDKKLDPNTRSLDIDGQIAAALERPECTGELNRCVEVFLHAGKSKAAGRRVIIVCLGKRESFDPAGLRTTAGMLGRRLVGLKESKLQVELAGALTAPGVTTPSKSKVDLEYAGRCMGEGFGLIAWNYTRFKGKGAEHTKRTALSVATSEKTFDQGLRFGLGLAESTNIARDLSETPPNIATPAYMGDFAKSMARKVGLSCRVIDGRDLVREKLEGLINVGKGSEFPPCLIRLEYRPKSAAARNKKPLVLVGKTMTYDSGGLSLKISNGMVGMKRDKDGGCAVIGAMHAIATLIQPNRPVIGLLAAAENSVSERAYRPDDVLTYRNGVTVEVTNTDAEGRLVLADALVWACEVEKPAAIVDLATLTGGVVVALGSTFAGMFCEDEDLLGKLQGAMTTSGERWWRLPMDAEYRDMMKSPIADIVNSNPNRKAHPIQGAAFLSYFVEKGIPWAHIDIAGVHTSDGDSGPFIKGPTGWGVRLLADLAAQ